jgi:hypothetical protein
MSLPSHFLGREYDFEPVQCSAVQCKVLGRLETELAPAELLSLLGFHGHRVVGVGSSRDGRMVSSSVLFSSFLFSVVLFLLPALHCTALHCTAQVWTLERKYYEFHDEL